MLKGLNRGHVRYEPLSDSYTEEITTKSGRKFVYRIGESMRPLRAGDGEARLELFVQQAMSAKLKECEWDRDHPLVNSEGEIRAALIVVFREYLTWLNSRTK